MRNALRSRAIRTFAATQFLLEVQLWFPLWLIYLLDLGFSLATAVLADAVFRLVAVACELPVGVLADRIGRRRAYLVLCGLSVVTFGAIALITNVAWLFAVWIVWGVLWAFTSGAASTYLYELCTRDDHPVDPVKAFGMVRAVGHVAVVCSLLAAGYLYDVDHRLPWIVTAACAGIAFLLALTLPSVPGTHQDTRIATVVRGVRQELASDRVRCAVWLGALLLLFGWSARILFQPLALDLGLSARVTGWMYAAFAVASVLGSLASGYVGRRHRRTAVTAAFVLTLLALAVVAVADHLGPFVVLPVMGFGYALGMTVLEVFTNESTSPGVRAAIFGTVTSLAGVGIAVARPALGLVADARSPAWAAGLWAVVGVLVVVLAVPAIRRLPSAAAEARPVEAPGIENALNRGEA